MRLKNNIAFVPNRSADRDAHNHSLPCRPGNIGMIVIDKSQFYGYYNCNIILYDEPLSLENTTIHTSAYHEQYYYCYCCYNNILIEILR